MKLVHIYSGIFFVAFFACQSKNEALETALQLAGNNRPELEKVLHHYSQDPADSLKHKAAEFLIENMPGHYTLEGDLINKYRAIINTDTIGSYFAKKALDISLSLIDHIRETSHKEEDVKNIKADFLIRHIELSFEHLHEYTWLEDLPFELFLEYILPYRFENERLDLWHDSLHILPEALKELSFKDNTKYIIENIGTNFPLTESQVNVEYRLCSTLFNSNIYSDCHHITLKENFRSRASYLPATVDFFPHYANRNGYHYWNTIISPESKNIRIRGALERKTAKVYRKTYSRNEVPVAQGDEYIPDFFLNPFCKDVSDEYLHTTDITVRSSENMHAAPKHAYLCVFNTLSWVPIAIGQHQKHLAKFKKIGKNLVYLPTYYQKKKAVSLNFPFIVNLKGEIKYLIPDTCNRQKIVLRRKYPFNNDLYYYNQDLEQLVVEASNRPDFHDTDTVLPQFETSGITYAWGKIKTDQKFRYWRITHPRCIYLAELYFYDEQGNALKGKISPTDSLAFDNNPLTKTFLSNLGNILLDFNKPTQVSKIICLPRSDGNGIYPGNIYELFYYDLEGWKSIGKKVATDYHLEYDNVPQGALLWLHNHTTGIEERIFTYKKDEIRFW